MSSSISTYSHDSSSSETDTSETVGVKFLLEREYNSKEDIIQTLAEYSWYVKRKFRVCKSDNRRHYVCCTESECSFKANFNFSAGFKASKPCIQHSCLENFKSLNSLSAIVRREDVVE
jgi:hypothetical protein